MARSMKVTVTVSGEQHEVELNAGRTRAKVKDALAKVPDCPSKAAVLVNGQEQPLDSELRNGDQVTVMPTVGKAGAPPRS